MSERSERTAAYWCQYAWLADPTDGRSAVLADGVLVGISGDRIATIERGVAAPPAGAVRLDGVSVPGFANAHSHAFHRALRGRTHGRRGTFWTWRDQMYGLAATLDPDTYEALATAAYAEMALAGYTAVGEFHYLHHQPGGRPYDDANEMGRRLLTAAARAGVRITLLDACYLAGGIGEPVDAVQQRFSDGSAERWLGRVGALSTELDGGSDDAGRAQCGVAIHSVRAVEPAAMATVARFAAERNMALHAHVSEQPAENEACLDAYGVTPVGLLHRHGILGDRFTAVHATHLTTDDIDVLAATRSRCCICPTTERDLGDGIGPTAELRRTGGLCIGSDSHAVVDPFEETRAVELDERLRAGRRGVHDPGALLDAATRSGYAALGWDGGAVAVGGLADVVTVGLDSPRLAGADLDEAAGAIVFGASAADVRHVVVGGELVVSDGAHRTIDVAAELDRTVRRAWTLVQR